MLRRKKFMASLAIRNLFHDRVRLAVAQYEAALGTTPASRGLRGE
jgi:hypothetical protein